MSKYILGNYAYWMVLLLLSVGLYGMMFKSNLVKKVIGMNILQVAIIMFYLVAGSKPGGTVPVKDDRVDVAQEMRYVNPLPHTLMLTAIVVGVATNGVAYALLITIFQRYRTLEEKVLQNKMAKEKDDE